MEEENKIKEKSFEFSLMIIEVYKKMILQKEFIISKQIFRSATSIGANVAESQGGISKREFRNKMSIALKEALETRYWLELLTTSKLVDLKLDKEYDSLENIINLLYKIIKTTTENLLNENRNFSLNNAPILGID